MIFLNEVGCWMFLFLTHILLGLSEIICDISQVLVSSVCFLYSKYYDIDYGHRLFKSFKFGNGSRISDEKLVILESKYLSLEQKMLERSCKKYLLSCLLLWLEMTLFRKKASYKTEKAYDLVLLFLKKKFLGSGPWGPHFCTS